MREAIENGRKVWKLVCGAALILLNLDRVIAAGYDGVYLDRVDAYWYWRHDHATAEADMIEFVKDIATYARTNGGGPTSRSTSRTRRNSTVTPTTSTPSAASGARTSSYNGNRPQPKSETRYAIKQLDRFKAAGKPVLVTDYVTKRDKINDFYRKVSSRG